MSRSDFFNLSAWGGPKYPSAEAVARAALMRAALVTFRGWEIWREALQQKAIELRPYRRVLQDGPSP
eukprot:8085876-Pyramimonas_sp.AAC.1